MRLWVSAALTFLRAQGVDAKLNAPGHAIFAALYDARSGRSSLLLKANKYREGTPRKPEMEIRQWSTAAVAVTILKDDAKWPLLKALRRAAEAIGVDAKELGEFRKNIGKRRAPKEAIDHYQHFLQTFRHYNPDVPGDRPDLSPEDRAGRLLGLAQDLSSKKGN